jgi:hypothetical protein
MKVWLLISVLDGLATVVSVHTSRESAVASERRYVETGHVFYRRMTRIEEHEVAA